MVILIQELIMGSQTDNTEHTQTLTEKEQYWLSHYQACRQNKMQYLAYARAHQLKSNAFNGGIKRLRQKGIIPPAAPLNRKTKSAFKKMRIDKTVTPSASVIIHLKNGHRLELSAEQLTGDLLQQLSQLP